MKDKTVLLIILCLFLLFIPMTFAAALSTPDNLRIDIISTNLLNITWDSVSGADNYTLYRSTSAEASYSRIVTTEKIFYLDSNLTPDTTYFYEITASNSSGSSSESEPVNATTQSGASLILNTLMAVPTTKNRMDLFWDKASGGAKYTLYRSLSKTGDYVSIAQELSDNSYVDSDLQPNTTYFYKLSVLSSSGMSPLSDAVEAKTFETEVMPNLPSSQPEFNLTNVIRNLLKNATNATNSTNITNAENTTNTTAITNATNSHNEINTENASLTGETSNSTLSSVKEIPSSQSNSNIALYVSFSALFLVIIIVLVIFKFANKKSTVVANVANKNYLYPKIIQLKEYVLENLKKGYTKNQIGTVMMQHGYPKELIDEVMRNV